MLHSLHRGVSHTPLFHPSCLWGLPNPIFPSPASLGSLIPRYSIPCILGSLIPRFPPPASLGSPSLPPLHPWTPHFSIPCAPGVPHCSIPSPQAGVPVPPRLSPRRRGGAGQPRLLPGSRRRSRGAAGGAAGIPAGAAGCAAGAGASSCPSRPRYPFLALPDPFPARVPGRRNSGGSWAAWAGAWRRRRRSGTAPAPAHSSSRNCWTRASKVMRFFGNCGIRGGLSAAGASTASGSSEGN